MKTSYITSFFILSATIFVGGCSLTQKSNPNPVPTPTVSSTGESVENATVSSTADEVDTSTWKTYRNEELGFEIKVPAEWGEPKVLREPLSDIYVFWDSTDLWMRVSMIRSAKTIEDVLGPLNTFSDDERITMYGMDGYRHFDFLGKQRLTDDTFMYVDNMILEKDGTYYLFDFTSNSSDDSGSIHEASRVWQKILETVRFQ